MKYGFGLFFWENTDSFYQFPLKIGWVHDGRVFIQKFRYGDTETGQQLFQNIDRGLAFPFFNPVV